jgi:hypothetical protein
MSGLSPVEPSYPVIKRLLENQGTVWLFEVHEWERITYQVERGERCWVFANLVSAQAKFRHEVAKIPNGGIAATSEKRATNDPGVSETAKGGQP